VASGSPRNAALIIAAAQPTPLSTCSAPTGQLIWHAPHSMHASGRTMRTIFSPVINTPCGQTALHTPQLTHLSALNAKVLRELAATKLSSVPQPVSAEGPQAHVVSAQHVVWIVISAP